MVVYLGAVLFVTVLQSVRLAFLGPDWWREWSRGEWSDMVFLAGSMICPGCLL